MPPDFDAEMNSVRSRSSFACSSRIAAGCVVSSTWKRSPPNVCRSTSGASDEPPMPSSTTSSTVALDGVGEREQQVDVLEHPRTARRASRASGPRRGPSRRSGRATRSARRARAARSSSRAASSPCLARIPAISSSNEATNFSTPSASSVCDDVVVVDARLAQLGRAAARPRRRPRAPCRRAPRRGPGRRSTRLGRHRVHGVGADQLLDVEHVAVGRVLGRGRGPERPLHARALRGERLPARPGERLLEVLVGELRVRDRRACPAAPCCRAPRAACRSRCRSARRRTTRPTPPSTGRRPPRRAARARGCRPRRRPRSARARRSA